MTSISGSVPPGGYVIDPSKVRTFPDAKPVSYVPEDYFEKLGKSEEEPAELVPNNGEENVWGRINLPNGEIVTIYNGGGVETGSTLLDIDWTLQTEEERAQAILAKYGGVLKVEEPPAKAPEVGSDVASFWSNVMGNDSLSERMLGAPNYRLVPDELIWLEHGDERRYDVTFRVLSGKDDIAREVSRIEGIAKQPAEEYPALSGRHLPIEGR